MNGYVVIALDIMLIAGLWWHFGYIAALFAVAHVAIITVALVRYNRFVVHVITTMREKIEDLTGRPYAGPTD